MRYRQWPIWIRFESRNRRTIAFGGQRRIADSPLQYRQTFRLRAGRATWESRVQAGEGKGGRRGVNRVAYVRQPAKRSAASGRFRAARASQGIGNVGRERYRAWRRRGVVTGVYDPQWKTAFLAIGGIRRGTTLATERGGDKKNLYSDCISAAPRLKTGKITWPPRRTAATSLGIWDTTETPVSDRLPKKLARG